MSKTKPITTLVTTPASFRHDNILAMVILGVLCCIQYDDQSVVVTSFTTGLHHHHHHHHHHRADPGVVTKISPVLTLLSSTSTATAPRTTRTRTASLQGFFGGMFGEAKDDQNPDDKKEKVLAEYNVGTNKDDVDVQFASLSDYLVNQWAPLFLTGTIKLTTAVELVKLPSDTDSNNVNGNVAGCQLLFKKSETGYVSKSEEGEGAYAPTSTTMEATTTGSYQPPPSTDNNNNNNTNVGDAKKTTTTTKKKKEEKKQGGVEIQVVVEKLASASASASASSYSLLQVRAKRCEVDEDTMIKEMSEEVIIQELKKAIGVWKKKSE